MNDSAPNVESEFVLRRLAEAFPVGPSDSGPALWLAATGAALLVALFFVAWNYRVESRTIRWHFAAPLALLRMAVYVLIAGAFLLPAVQTWERSEKRSRVLVLIDVSPSVSEVSDEVSRGAGAPPSRLKKLLDFLSDDKVAFLARLFEKNPVAAYRFGSRLDDEGETLTADQRFATPAEWAAWAGYDFKPFLLKGLSPAGRDAVIKLPAWKGAEPGPADWALAWAKLPEADTTPPDLAPSDAEVLKANRGRVEQRVDVARSIVAGTDVPGSLLQLLDREGANMLQGVVVFSDGRSNLGSASALTDLQERMKREQVPVFTVALGEARENVTIALGDVQAPDRAPPDEPFKLVVEADGTGLSGQEVEVRLGLYAPGKDPKGAADHELTAALKFGPGEPPHGQAEFTIDPDKLPDALTEVSKKVGRKRQMKSGPWQAVARVARDRREAFAEADHATPPRTFQVLDKPLRVLLFAGGPTREFQTLRTLLVREVSQSRAEVSIALQTEGGRDGTAVQDVPPERLLPRFPTRLTTAPAGDAKPEEKYLNLNEYDLIIAFDPDWSELSAEQMKNLQTWVDNLGGGLVYVGGPVHTYQLARAADDGRLRPLLDILPVLPDDIILIKTRPVPRAPRRLVLKPTPEADILKLDETKVGEPTAGWEPFFSGREKLPAGEDPRRMMNPDRGFYAYYPVKSVKPGAQVLAEFLDPGERGEAVPQPWLVTTQPSRGRTAFLAAGELWRLRPFNTEYYERFWIKLARYAAANRDVRAARGRVLLGKEVVSGAPMRVQVRLLDPTGRPYPDSQAPPKFTVRRLDPQGERLSQVGPDGKTPRPLPDLGPFELKPRKGAGGFDGYYAGQFLADAKALPPGTNRYRVLVEVPDSPGEVLEGEFQVRRSDPERDNTRPDFAALAALASPAESVRGRVADASLFVKIAGGGDAGAKLAFRLGETERVALIPECLEEKRQTLRNRGPVRDLWDRGPTFAWDGKPVEVSALLLAVVGLLSAEWLARKLLRLA